jgi:NhaA family Na+:H+ antiporter
LGVLALLRTRVPLSLKIFLTALAIADDMGAVLVIAIFYTDTIVLTELLTAGIGLAVLIFSNYMGVRNRSFYYIVGITVVWVSFMYSGVHATIAGILFAFTIPSDTKIDTDTYLLKTKKTGEEDGRS